MRAVLHPEARGSARIIAGHHVDALAHQLRDQQPAAEPREHRRRPPVAVGRDDQIVRAAGIAGGLEPELARRVAREDVAGEHAVGDELAIVRLDALLVERRAAHGLGDVRPLRDGKPGRKHLLHRRSSAKKRTAGTGCCRGSRREVPDQAARHLRHEQHRGAPRGELARPEPRDGAARALAPDSLGILAVRASRAKCSTNSRAACPRPYRRARRSSRCARSWDSRRRNHGCCRRHAVPDAC